MDVWIQDLTVIFQDLPLIFREGLQRWPGGPEAAERKDRSFDDWALGIAVERLGRQGMA